jgi:hypothetical protein
MMFFRIAAVEMKNMEKEKGWGLLPPADVAMKVHTRVLPGVRWHGLRTSPPGRRSIACILFIRPEGL